MIEYTDITLNTELDEINAKFRALIQQISQVQTEITNLDLLRIQLMYQSNNPTISEFITTCWSKLSTYHAVYFSLGPIGELKWTDEAGEQKIHTGDYLIKMPDNKSIYIAGSDNRYYYPHTYDPNSGQLGFQLSTDTDPVDVFMPLWVQGSEVGRVTHSTWVTPSVSSMVAINDSSDSSMEALKEYYEPYIQKGTFYREHEQIIFPPNLITVTSTSRPTVDRLLLAFKVPYGITGYHIPYIIPTGTLSSSGEE